MTKEKIEFKDFSKECKFRTYQENKCVNEKSKGYRMPGSCQETGCPLFNEKAEARTPATGAEGKPDK